MAEWLRWRQRSGGGGSGSGSTASSAAAPQQEARRQRSNGVSGSLPAAWRRWWQAARWQRNGCGHGLGSRRHHCAATARHRVGDENTDSNSDSWGTDKNQQSTKISNGIGIGYDDSNENDDGIEGNGGSGNSVGSVAAA